MVDEHLERVWQELYQLPKTLCHLDVLNFLKPFFFGRIELLGFLYNVSDMPIFKIDCYSSFYLYIFTPTPTVCFITKGELRHKLIQNQLSMELVQKQTNDTSLRTSWLRKESFGNKSSIYQFHKRCYCTELLLFVWNTSFVLCC